MSLEILSRDLIQRRLAEAHQDAFAAQLPRPPVAGRLDWLRPLLASALRALAIRLDPSVASSKPRFVVLTSR